MVAKKPVTLKDVADHAGVSTATASYALNNTRAVGADVRAKVEAAAQKLGYRPNVLAQGLKTGSSRLVTCIVSNLSNPLLAAAVEGANAVLRREGYGMLIFRSGPRAEDVSDGAEFAASYRSAGLLVVHPFAEQSPLIRQWVLNGRPTAFAVHPHLSIAADHVLMAEEDAGYRATQFLIENGHRAIALLSRSLDLEIYARLAEGHYRALAEAGIPVRKAYTRSHERRNGSSAEKEHGFRETAALLGLAEPPTAILCAHNQIAIGVLRALRDRDLSIPRDMSLMSFDHVDWMGITDPTIASIGIDGEVIGRTAAEHLVARIRGEAGDVRTTRLRLSLSPGESVARLSR